MPRPFAVAGFTMFFVLLVLCCTGIAACLPAALVMVAALVAFLIIPKTRRQKVLPLAMFAGVLSCALFAFNYYIFYQPALSLDGGSYDISAVLEDGGETDYGRWYYNAEIDGINGTKCSYKVRFSFREKLDAGPYDRVRGVFTVYAKQNGSSGVFKINSSENLIGAYPAEYTNESIAVSRIPENQKPLIYKFIVLRERVAGNIRALIPGDYGEIACGLLFGKAARFPSSLKVKFNGAGISHIICVSGLHLSIWALFIFKLFGKIGLDKRVSAVVSSLFIVGYMALTGFTYSVLRAGIMMLVLLAGTALFRRGDSVNSLGIAAIIILAVNPFSACDVGFLLSFLSTLGLILFMPRLSAYIDEKLEGKKKFVSKPVKYISIILLTTLCACAFTLPVSIVCFGQVNLLSFLGNLLIIPAVSVCMISAGAAALFSLFTPLGLLKYPSALVCSLTSKYICVTVEKLSKIRFLTFYPRENLAYIWLGGAFLIICVALYFRYLGSKTVRVTSALLLATFVSMIVISYAFYADIAEITVIDNGKAPAVLITENGYSALVGCGEEDYKSSSVICGELEDRHIENLNLIVIPRNTKAVSGCAEDIIAFYPPDVLACSGASKWDYLLPEESDSVTFGEKFVMQLCDGIKVTCVNSADGCYALFNVYGRTVLTDFGNLPQGEKSDFLITQSGDDIYYYNDYNAVILSDDETAVSIQNELNNNGVLCVATAGQGNVTISVASDGEYKLYRE
ncbi:MAG: ComEC/Rec2 family competence protein [Clostridia bacterium]|nr:ComEC/Rec2 family competence protein [Clostridia bacterium]